MGLRRAFSRVPDALQRATLLRRAGTQEATHSTAAWAPALRIGASRRTASGARELSFWRVSTTQ